ncbi:biliverdin-producing heme oxygenase [Paenibacillus urinalis]|uniref:Biliverdin-producing heme oxygenase n=1 Tax=Paenibacillus urinalis TaxID=521520 RepID=A0AAX3MXX0_9BACL|nr:biliverdin-producing heme oxygenase [Paenibacillus urinalis]WDH82198.1 biliverdin-producing heme oxygenase [Paenibacillus urinalis]WDH98248.1 biliverdin-producing heme oxygenase [Paenibacillus urinalis]WDI01933.1 biliverdin-producing heme oxygenase [Paenibacillus urinalis]
MTTIMEQLRKETAEEHDRIEQNDYAKAIMNHTLNKADYQAYLEKFYGFILPIEQKIEQLDGVQELGIDMKHRAKSPLLEQDLAYLSSNRQQVPLCSEIPEIALTEQLLGYLYVIEGSTLGGQVITRKLREHLALEPGAGLSYFNAYGQDTRVAWKELSGIMNSAAEAGANREVIVGTAKETFRLLNQWVNTTDHSE